MTSPMRFSAPNPAHRDPAPVADLRLPTLPAGAKPRCLVLVENTSIRMLVRLILSLEGWDAADHDTPLNQCQALIADLDCFKAPAEHVAAAVRGAAHSGLAVLALTGQDLTPQEWAALGNPPLLLKPFELTSFLGIIHAWRRYDPVSLGTT